jgi:hypothetical protein
MNQNLLLQPQIGYHDSSKNPIMTAGKIAPEIAAKLQAYTGLTVSQGLQFRVCKGQHLLHWLVYTYIHMVQFKLQYSSVQYNTVQSLLAYIKWCCHTNIILC